MTQSGLEEALLATYTKLLSPEGSVSEHVHFRQNPADPLEGCSSLPTGAGMRTATGLENESCLVTRTSEVDPHGKGGPYKSLKYKERPPVSPRKKKTTVATAPPTPEKKEKKLAPKIPAPPPPPENVAGSELMRSSERMGSLRSALKKAAGELRSIPDVPARTPAEPLLDALTASMTRMTKNFDEFDKILAARRAAVDEAIGRSSEDDDEWDDDDEVDLQKERKV